jgi:hypothetical protein
MRERVLAERMVSAAVGMGSPCYAYTHNSVGDEAGCDVELLKKRGRGRPGRGAETSQVVALRLTLDRVAELDARAEREGKTRSEVIREALTRLAG